jgi:ABC-2 type transport system permease protein
VSSLWLASGTLLKREVVRFLRQPNRVVGALGTPLVFWFLIGSGQGRSFQFPGRAGSEMDYLQYFFPGALLMILLFTAIFSTISIIEDRREGFLQGVLVSPAPRSSVVLGKLLGGAFLAFGQGLVFLALSPVLDIRMTLSSGAYVAALMFVVSFGLTGLGFALAWRMESTQGFHAVMNLFLMPLWFLSGALFPPSGAPGWLRAVMDLNPLTYTVYGLHRGFYADLAPGALGGPSAAACLMVTLAFAAATFLLAVGMAHGRES